MTDDTRSSRSDRDSKKGGGGSREPDLASDPSFFWRFIKTSLSAFGNDVGKRGYDIGPVHDILESLEKLVGPEATGIAINALAATIQEPAIVKKWVRRIGWPEQINGLADEFIDDVFEGLRMAYRERGKVSQTDANRALAGAQDKQEARLGKGITYAEALQLLDPAQQAAYQAKVTALGVDRLATFDKLRGKINSPRDLKTLILLPVDQWIPHLEQKFGAVKPPEKKSAIAGLFDTITGVATGAIKRLTDPVSDTEKAEMQSRQAKIKQDTQDIKDRRKNRGW